jgi:hypothetical protein
LKEGWLRFSGDGVVDYSTYYNINTLIGLVSNQPPPPFGVHLLQKEERSMNFEMI